MKRVGKVVGAVILLAALAACNVREGEQCNNPGEISIQDKVAFKCIESPGEFRENSFGKKFPVSRWKRMEVAPS